MWRLMLLTGLFGWNPLGPEVITAAVVSCLTIGPEGYALQTR